MAGTKFKPKVSTNIIEGATPVEETEGKVTPAVDETETTNTPEEGVVNTPEQESPTTEETSAQVAPTEESPKTEETPSVEEKSEEKSEEETKTTTPTVTFEDKKSTPAVKNVKICLKVKHSCTIGGVQYHFEKGKQYNVPSSVKSILMQADLLMPL